jgi:hypothetical protein
MFIAIVFLTGYEVCGRISKARIVVAAHLLRKGRYIIPKEDDSMKKGLCFVADASCRVRILSAI